MPPPADDLRLDDDAKGKTFARFIDQFYARVAPNDLAARTPETVVAAARSVWEPGRQARAANRQSARDRSARAGAHHRRDRQRRHAVPAGFADHDDRRRRADAASRHPSDHGGAPPCASARSPTFIRPAKRPTARCAKSIMRLEIEQATDAAERAKLRDTLLEALAEVRGAVEDWREMRDAVATTQAALTARPPRAAPELVPEARSFLSWLLDDYFVLLGSRQYIFDTGTESEGDIVPGSGRGILRDGSRSVFEGLRHFVDLPAYTRAFLLTPRIVEVSRSSERSRVLRAAPMDAIAIKMFDHAGRAGGLAVVRRPVHLACLSRQPADRAAVGGKVENVLRRSGAPLGSHDRRALVHIIESLPRDELFQIGEDQLLAMALGIRDLEQRPRVGLFIRPDPFGRFYSCFVFVPRDRYRTELRQRFVSILTSALDARLETFHVALDDQALARVTFFLRTEPKPRAEIDVAAIERRLADAARNWSDGLHEALIARQGR